MHCIIFLLILNGERHFGKLEKIYKINQKHLFVLKLDHMPSIIMFSTKIVEASVLNALSE